MTVEGFLHERPLLLLFAVASLGYGGGRLKIRGFSLGVAAVLFAGLPIYRDCEHVEYAFTHAVSISAGKRTGNTPDGRRSGEPLATGVRESVTGLDAALTAALSAAKVPCEAWRDGVSTRAELTESELGKNADERISRLVTTLDALFATGLFHLELQVRCATSKRR